MSNNKKSRVRKIQKFVWQLNDVNKRLQFNADFLLYITVHALAVSLIITNQMKQLLHPILTKQYLKNKEVGWNLEGVALLVVVVQWG